MSEPQEKKKGNPNWVRGVSPNPAGRPKVLNKEKKTNRELRQESLLALTRKLYPHLTKSVQAAVNILDNKESSESGKLKASALIISTYSQLIKDLYNKDYDDDSGEAIMQDNKPILSLRVLDNKEVQ